MMGLHKLTAGDGYLYLIRQVAAGDATDRGRPSLADYYSSKGETPGRWMGRGLASLGRAGRPRSVRSAGRAAVVGARRVAGARRPDESPLRGRAAPQRRPDHPPPHRRRCGQGRSAGRRAAGSPVSGQRRGKRVDPPAARGLRRLQHRPSAPSAAPRSPTTSAPASAPPWAARCSPKTTAAHRLTIANCPASSPANPGPQTTAVAGYDLTFTPVKSVSVLWAMAPAASGAGDRGMPPPSSGRSDRLAARSTPPFPAWAPTVSPRSTPPG